MNTFEGVRIDMGHVKILKKELELISDQYGHFGERLGRIKLI